MIVFYVYQYLVEQLLHLLVAYFPQTAHRSSEGTDSEVEEEEDDDIANSAVDSSISVVSSSTSGCLGLHTSL